MFLLLKYFEDAIFLCLLELQDHLKFAVLLQAERKLLTSAVKRMMGNVCSPELTDLPSHAVNRGKAEPSSPFLQYWL